MGQPAAKQNDKVIAIDTHIIMVPSPSGAVPTPLPHPFNGMLDTNLSANVKIMGLPAATVGSIASNVPPHIPQGGPFQVPPTNKGNVMIGSMTVLINNKPAARMGDTVLTCNDPAPAPVGKIVVAGMCTVMIG